MAITESPYGMQKPNSMFPKCQLRKLILDFKEQDSLEKVNEYVTNVIGRKYLM